MSRNRRILNAGGVPFLVLKGFFVVSKGKQPDGDTLSFVAGRAYQSGGVKTNITVVNDGQKLRNVRFQSIDTPEKAQPLGAAARDSLLTALGFDVGQLGLSDTDFTADEGVHKVPGWIATHGMDGNGRALSYVFAEDPGLKHGAVVSAEQVEQILPLSANYAQAASGMAFPAFYSNTDEGHAYVFQQVSRQARKQKLGVWKVDKTTTGFVPTKAALGAKGALVYPKFFRRVEKWKAAAEDADAFLSWIRTQSDGKKKVEGAAKDPVPLASLFEKVDARMVCVPYDVTRLWFSEK